MRKCHFDIKTSSIKNLVSQEDIFNTIKIRWISRKKFVLMHQFPDILLILSFVCWYYLLVSLPWSHKLCESNPCHQDPNLNFFIFELIWNLWEPLSGCQRWSSHSPYMGALPLHTNTRLWLGSWLASPLHAVVENLECCLLYLCSYWLTKKF